jgi:glutathione transport system permease protein
MLRHALRRVVPVLLGVLLIGVLLMQVVPTDAATVRAGPTASPEVVEAIRRDLGLDKPVYVQFGLYLWRLAQGGLGVSIINNVPMTQELGATIGPTLELMVMSLIWAIPIGILLGTVAAYRRGGVIDKAVLAFSVAGGSVPVFFLGLLLIWYVGFQWQLLPFTGRGGRFRREDGLKAIALPALTLGGVFIGPVARMKRTAVVDVPSAGHVRTARAKGLTERRVVTAHALRNALIPVVALIGLLFRQRSASWPGRMCGSRWRGSSSGSHPRCGRKASGRIASTASRSTAASTSG